jgi:transcriptional regulator with XRE-family HTH domain
MTDSHTPAQCFARQLATVRRRKGWSQQQLADATAELGHPVTQSAVAKIERGTRGVGIDDVFHFAAALGVPPIALLVPSSDSDLVEISPGRAVPGWEASLWVRGIVPPMEETEVRDAGFLGFFYDQYTDAEKEAIRRHPGVRHLFMLAELAMRHGVLEALEIPERPDRATLRNILVQIQKMAEAEVSKIDNPIEGMER